MHLHLVSEFHDRADLPLQIFAQWVILPSVSQAALGHSWESMSLNLGLFDKNDILKTTSVVKELVLGHLIKILGPRYILSGLHGFFIKEEPAFYHLLVWGLVSSVF